jgi:hypothetical protein
MRRLVHKTTSIWKREEGFLLLLPTLILAIFVAPLLKEWLPVLAAASTAFSILLFVVGAFVVARNIWGGIFVFLLAGAAIALEMLRQFGGVDSFAPLRLGAACLALGLFTFVVLARVFAPAPVTSYRLVGAVVAYLLVGLTWAYIYDLLEVVHPGSFNTAHGGMAEGSYPTVLYYSFVTLTTVGYGDITPVSAAARALSNLESLVGVLFPAILIGRLLSMRASGAPPEPPGPG